MKTQIKRIGSASKGIILSPEFLKFHGLDIGDWVDCSDLFKIEMEVKNECATDN